MFIRLPISYSNKFKNFYLFNYVIKMVKKIQINLSNKTYYTLIVIGVIVLLGIIVYAVAPNPGHTWGEIECPGCITTADIGDGQVQTADIGDGQVQTADIGDGQVSNSKINSMEWNKLTSRPTGLDDGDDYTTCSWSGWAGATGCLPCSDSWEFCAESLILFELYCSGGKVTQARTKSCCIECGVNGGYG